MDERELVALADKVTEARTRLDELLAIKGQIPRAKKQLADAERRLREAASTKNTNPQLTDLETLQARIDAVQQQEAPHHEL
ncbi:hypothetical protein [Pseudomonas umsongensis]|uniref:Uncharacterized protein n=1 Tax=Pseudomonas umsongensis TaxID=198618 RepID=A0AAE6ZTR3_9PSED|nr:hypothetical protein [Pseudomonas umsongensis]QJC78214.1 hypothetical protein HGP31_07790 [Pseudomonas umsongensis]